MDPDEVLKHISKFVYWLAHRHANPNVPLMDIDEIIGELFYEVAKGIERYGDKPLGELLAILRKMCDNRVAELKYKYMVTHRRAAITAYSIEVVEIDPGPDSESAGGENSPGYNWVMDNAVATSEIVASAARVTGTRNRLSDSTKNVFDAVIFGDNMLAVHILLSGMRASAVYKSGGSVKVKPWHVARALNMDEADVKVAFSEIKDAYKAVKGDTYG